MHPTRHNHTLRIKMAYLACLTNLIIRLKNEVPLCLQRCGHTPYTATLENVD